MQPVRRADNLATIMCRVSSNLGASTTWNPQGLSRPVMRLLYLYHIGSLPVTCLSCTVSCHKARRHFRFKRQQSIVFIHYVAAYRLLTVSCNWVHQTCRFYLLSQRGILPLCISYAKACESEKCEILTEVHCKRALNSSGNFNALAKRS
jgi:hypothetical protein